MTDNLNAPALTNKQKVDWRRRELTRMNDGTYEAFPERFGFLAAGTLPDTLSDNPYGSGAEYARALQSLHFVHPACENYPHYWAFTQDEQNGADDRQTRMLPAKYLKKFYSDLLTAEQIEAIASEWEKEADIAERLLLEASERAALAEFA